MTARVLLTLGCLGALASPVRAQAAPSTASGFVSEVMLQFETSMEKFIALAEAMPADKFGWSPGTGTMTVAKVYSHVARYNYLYPATSLGVKAPDGREADAAEVAKGRRAWIHGCEARCAANAARGGEIVRPPGSSGREASARNSAPDKGAMRPGG